MQGLIGGFERVCFADFGIVAGAWANATFERVVVDINETEAWPETLVPLEVVEE